MSVNRKVTVPVGAFASSVISVIIDDAMKFVVGADEEDPLLEHVVDGLRRRSHDGRVLPPAPRPPGARGGGGGGAGGGGGRGGRSGSALLLDRQGDVHRGEQGRRRPRGTCLGPVDRRGRAPVERRQPPRDEPK